MVVDVDDLRRHTLTARLRQHGYDAIGTGDPFEARDLLADRDVDVVLLGLVGLDLSGLALLEDVARLRPFSEVILINDSDHVALSIAAMRRGVFAEVVAPFDLAELIDLIDSACAGRRPLHDTNRGPSTVSGARSMPNPGEVLASPPTGSSGDIVPSSKEHGVSRRGTPSAGSPSGPAPGREDEGEPRGRRASEGRRTIAGRWTRPARSE